MKNESFDDLFRYIVGLCEGRGVISFVGASGKTTMINECAERLSKEGRKILWTTSTAIGKPDKEDYDELFIGEIDKSYEPKPGSVTVYGDMDFGTKIKAQDIEKIDQIIERKIFDYVLIEADGAKMKFLKAPRDYEPVISKHTDITIGLIGTNTLGALMEDVVHRVDVYKEVTDSITEDRVNGDQLIKLIRSDRGLFKDSLGKKILVMNKVERRHEKDIDYIRREIDDLDIEFHICKYGDIGGVKMNDLVVVRSGGDIATGVIQKLYNSGFKVIVLEVEEPTCIRKTVSLSNAIYEGASDVEGMKAIKADTIEDVKRILGEGNIPVYIDPDCSILDDFKPLALIDSTLSKRNLGMKRGMVPVTIGIGPGYEAGVDVDYVVESSRGHDLGVVLDKGRAKDNTGIPGTVLGYSEERVIRSPGAGKMKNLTSIGEPVEVGDPLCEINGEIVKANIPGIVRGLLTDGLDVKEGMKIGDIDPRNRKENAYTISDKARTIGGAVLEIVVRASRKVEEC